MTTRERALSLYAEGLRPSIIALMLGVTRQRVSFILRRGMGSLSQSDRVRARNDDIRASCQAGAGVDATALRFGVSPTTVRRVNRERDLRAAADVRRGRLPTE